MLQRIQTLFLALAVFLNIGFFFTPLFERVFEDPSGWFRSAIFTAVGLAAIISAVSIFMYRNRTSQLRWVRNAMIFQILGAATATGVFFTLGRIGSHLSGEAIGLGLLLLAVIFQLLAASGIKKDERLVRSMERIR